MLSLLTWENLKGIPAGFADGVDNDTVPTWTTLAGVPAAFADGVDDVGDAWSGITGIPAGFADGTDDTSGTASDVVCTGCVDASDLAADAATQGELDALSANDGAINQGSDPLNWTKLKDVPADLADGDNVGGAGGLPAYCALLAEPGNYAPCAIVLSTVDSSADVGPATSMAISADGNPTISYYDATTDDLKVAKCDDPSCSGGGEILTTVDAAGDVGSYQSLAIGTDGTPVISYFDDTSDDLKVVKCNDSACTGGGETITAVDTADAVGANNSIAIGTDGNPVISYRDATNLALKVVKCNDPACTGGGETISAPDSSVGTNVDDPGIYTAIAISVDGFPVIAYRHAGDKDLKVAKCNDAACTGSNETLTVVDATADSLGRFSSIVIGTDGNPTIAYRNDGGILKVVHCDDPACVGGESLNNVQVEGDAGYSPSIAIGIDGNPIVSYHAALPSFDDMRVVRCNDPACAGGFGDDPVTAVDTAGSVGGATSIAIGTDGVAVISYYDATNTNLKVARVP